MNFIRGNVCVRENAEKARKAETAVRPQCSLTPSTGGAHPGLPGGLTRGRQGNGGALEAMASIRGVSPLC